MKKFYSFILFSLFFVQTIHAHSPKVEELYSSTSRPTMTEFFDAFEGKLPEENPFQFDPYFNWSNNGRTFRVTESEFRTLLLNEVPRTIARMERAFRGAKWVPIGRDAAAFGDLLDAFYRSLGQTDRVARLDVSTNSFVLDDVFIDYLKQKGAVFDPEKIKDARPFVAFDRTSYGTWRTSQSQLFMQAGYNAFKAAGGDPKNLITKFNVLTTEPVSIGQSSARSRVNGVVVDANNVESFFEGLRDQIDSHGFPQTVLALESNISDLAEWHNSFGGIYRNPNGEVVPTVGASWPRQYRDRVLWEMYEVARVVTLPEFRKNLETEAQKLGYEFPFGPCSEVLR